jgi:hypothetical protein
MQRAETHSESDSLVDNAICGAHYHVIAIIILGAKIAPTLYLDVQKQAPIVPANSLSILLLFSYTQHWTNAI